MNTPIFGLPLKELIGRIRNATDSTGLLYPARFISSPQLTVEGVDQLPRINFQNYNDEDTSFSGGAKTNPFSTSIVRTKQVATFLLAFNKENGYQSEDGETRLGLMDWVSRFKDAVELIEPGQPDLTLNGSCIEPMEIVVENTEADEISWNIEFSISLYPVPYARSSRSLPDTRENIETSTFPMTFPANLG